MQSLSPKQVYFADNMTNQFVEQGWNSAFGQNLKANGLISSILPIAMAVYQNLHQHQGNRSDLIGPLEQALISRGFTPGDLEWLQVHSSGDFSGISSRGTAQSVVGAHRGAISDRVSQGTHGRPVSTGDNTPVSGPQPGGMAQPRRSPSRNNQINNPQAIGLAQMLVQQGWNSTAGQQIQSLWANGLRQPNFLLTIYRQVIRMASGRHDLWGPIAKALQQAGVPLNASTLGQFQGETNPAVLVNRADNMFQQKGAVLCDNLLESDPRALSRLNQVRQGALAGDWANKQIMNYTRECLIERGAPAILVSQATMAGEGELEQAVEGVIKRANNGDQNAMAMLAQVRKQALGGSPQAILAYNHAMQVVSAGCDDLDESISNHVSDSVSGRPLSGYVSGGVGYAATMGAERRKRAVPTHKQVKHAHAASHPMASKHHPISTLPGTGSGSSSGQGSRTGSPIDQLVAAAKAGNKSAIKEIDTIANNAEHGDQRAISLMQAIQAKYGSSGKSKQARAVGISHGKPVTSRRIAKMAGDFGYEFGPGGANLFMRGVANPTSRVPPGLPSDAANCLTTGQCIGLAQRLQAARVPGAALSVLNPMMGWEHGEFSFGDEGQITARNYAGDYDWAQDQMRAGDTGEIQVNRTAFILKLRQRNEAARKLDGILREIAEIEHANPPVQTIIIVTSDTMDDGASGQFASNPAYMGAEGQINARDMGDPNFAKQQIADGNVQTIDVNQDAFRILVAQVSDLDSKIGAAQASMNREINQIH